MNVSRRARRLAKLASAGAALAIAHFAHAQEAEQAWPEAYFEIFRLAPGAHEEFIRRIALSDEISATVAGLPPTQLYFHQEGDAWDVLMLKPVTGVELTREQEAAMAAKRREQGLPSGPAYFIDIRRLIASHTDTKATGPVTAAQWLARLDASRAETAGAQ